MPSLALGDSLHIAKRDTRDHLLLRLWSSPRLIWCIALIPYLIAIRTCVVKLLQGPKSAGNLHTFWNAAIALSHGQNIYRSGSGDYLYPPLIAFLYQPLGWMSIHQAGILMLILNTVIAVLTLKIIAEELLFRLTGTAAPLMVARVALITAWLSIDHIHTEFNQWETNFFLLLAFVLALKWADRLPVWAGIALGFGFNIKFLPVVLVPYLIIRRRWAMLWAFAVSAIFFALLPAISMGWKTDFTAIMISDSGIAHVLGFAVVAANSANVYPFTSLKSISLPSFFGRVAELSELYAMIVAGLFAIAAGLLWFYACRRRDLPAIAWPSARRQSALPYRGLFALDWIEIMLLALIFSPYTNSGHLYLLLAVNAGAAVLLLHGPKGICRWLLWVGAFLMLIGMIFPPGGDRYRVTELLWKRESIAGWCMYIFSLILIWIGIKHVKMQAEMNDRMALH
jgi:Glycosyltransferase family 87